MGDAFSTSFGDTESEKRREWMQSGLSSFLSSTSIALLAIILERQSDGKFKGSQFLEAMIETWRVTTISKVKEGYDALGENEATATMSKLVGIDFNDGLETFTTEINEFAKMWSEAMLTSKVGFEEYIDTYSK